MKKALFIIILAGITVRCIGINFGLPFAYHDDEPIIVNYALAYGSGDFNPHVFKMSPLLSYILFLLYGIFFVAGRLMGAFRSAEDFAYLYLNDPTLFYLIGRSFFGLLCGSASVYLIYLAGKRYFSEEAGILASFFLAFNFLHARDSHYVYFDIPLTLCVLLFFTAGHRFFGQAKRRDFIKLGALFGLAYSVKSSGILLIVPLAMFIVYSLFFTRAVKLRNRVSGVAWCGLSALAVAFVCNPFSFFNFQEFIKGATQLPMVKPPPLFHLKVSLFGGCGMLMVISGTAGMLYAIRRRAYASFPILAYALTYFLVISRSSQLAERLVMPIVPLVLLFCAYLLAEMQTAISSKKAQLIAIAAVVLLLSLPSLLKIYYCDLLFLREDTRTGAYHWIKKNIPADSKIAVDALSSGFPRIEKSKEQIRELSLYFAKTSFKKPAGSDALKLRLMLDNPGYPEKTFYVYYLRKAESVGSRGFLSTYPNVPADFQTLKTEHFRYVLLSRILSDESLESFVRRIERDADLLAVFSPYKEGISRTFSQEELFVPAGAFLMSELKHRKSFGPPIRIYRLKE